MSIGPVEYIVIGFPGNNFKGEIIPELRGLVENGTIRIIDLVFVGKDQDGNVAAIELADAEAEHAAELGEISEVGEGLLNDEDIQLAAESLPNNCSAALLVWENTWATRFADAVRRADGEVIENARIPHDIVEAAIAETAQA